MGESLKSAQTACQNVNIPTKVLKYNDNDDREDKMSEIMEKSILKARANMCMSPLFEMNLLVSVTAENCFHSRGNFFYLNFQLNLQTTLMSSFYSAYISSIFVIFSLTLPCIALPS